MEPTSLILSSLTSEEAKASAEPVSADNAVNTFMRLGDISNGGYANGVAVAGNYSYLANGGDGLRVYRAFEVPAPPSNVHNVS